MKPLFDENEDWTQEKIEAVYTELEKIAIEEMELELAPNQIEIISAENMLDAYSSMAMPIYYKHWSLGKSFITNQKSYEKGHQSLAYEVVINSNPVISYLQESNTMTMQALVVAHACFGHNAVFHNNVEFKRWTRPESIIDYLSFAKRYIEKAEETYGEKEVEFWLDSCHALMNHGVDTMKRKQKGGVSESVASDEYNLLWEKTVQKKDVQNSQREKRASGILEEPEENLLYFIQKNAPNLPEWKREIIRIVRKVAQYFYPQGLTKCLNEGMATFTHHYLLNRLYDKGLISVGAWQEFIQSHTNVILQPGVNDSYYSGINPYALGFAIFRDIKRICENPSEEDRKFFSWAGKARWQDKVKDAFTNYNDSSFIQQYLSPSVIREFKFVLLEDREESSKYLVEAIHNDKGYEKIRHYLSESHTRWARVPLLKITRANLDGDRTLTVKHEGLNGKKLERSSFIAVEEHLKNLWGYPVIIED